MIAARLRTLEEFNIHRRQNALVYNKISELEANLAKTRKETFSVKGFSYPAQKEVEFLVDYMYSNNESINWRERVVCPITNLNNRLRAAVHFMDFELSATPRSKIYIAEQVTPLYNYLKEKYPNIIGSEYLGPDSQTRLINSKGLRHEDATKLSFKDSKLDFYLSFDCFEHIPDFKQAFSEAYRVLRKDGILFWSAPFACTDQENIIRATINAEGAIAHLMPPDYHGDPANASDGILCYQYFGWEIFEQLKEIGFKDAYAFTYWCDSLGYYGGDQFLFFAIK